MHAKRYTPGQRGVLQSGLIEAEIVRDRVPLKPAPHHAPGSYSESRSCLRVGNPSPTVMLDVDRVILSSVVWHLVALYSCFVRVNVCHA